MACGEGHVRVVEALIDGGTPVDLPARRGWSPLFLACRDGREEVVRLLLARGANAGHRSAHGDTAAHWAADSDRAGAVALLFAAPGGAAAIAAQNGGGMTPLGRAVASGSVACEALLRALGAPEVGGNEAEDDDEEEEDGELTVKLMPNALN
jgi:hypothetical protein